MSSPQEFEEVENSLDSAEGRDFDELARFFHQAVWAREDTIRITESARDAAAKAIALADIKGRAILAIQQDQLEEVEGILRQARPALEVLSQDVNELIRQIWADLFCIARRFVDSDADAKDAAQRAADKIHRNLASFDADTAKFRSWYYTITKLTAFDVRREGSRWQQRRREFSHDDSAETKAASESESVRIVDQVLTQMSEDCRSRMKHLYPRGSKVGGHKEIATELQEDYEKSKKRTRTCIKMAKELFRTLAKHMFSSNAT